MNDVPPTEDPSRELVRYRADFHDLTEGTDQALEPVYESLEAAQKRCENDMRRGWTRGDLTFTWQPDNEDDPQRDPILWDLLVQTSRLPAPVRSGFSVAVVGSELDVHDPNRPPL